MPENPEIEEGLLRSVALQNSQSILVARQRAEAALSNAQEELRESHARIASILDRLQLAMDAAELGEWSWDAASDAMNMGARARAIFGIPGTGEITRSELRQLLHGSDAERAHRMLQRAIAGHEDYNIEYLVDLPGGGQRWVSTRGRNLYAADGSVSGMTGVVQDITGRKRIEQALEEEARVLELLNETGKVVASTLDLKTLLQTVTDKATELSNAKFGAFFYNTTGEDGEAFLLYVLCGAPPAAFEKFGNPRATALFGPTFNGAPPIRCDDVLIDPRYGQWAPHHGMPKGHLPVRSYLAVPVISRAGEVIGGLFFGHPDTGIFTERAERIVVGVAAQAAVAIDNARLYDAAHKAAEERRHLLDSERSARNAAERAGEIKDRFLATLSHELRTPLSAILGWSQVLKTRVHNDAEIRKGLEVIERNARVQTKLIEDLLDISRITSGKVRLDVQPVVPITFVEAAIESVRPSADAKGIRLEKVLDPGAGPVAGDPSRLQQIVWNLLSNAIKFTPKGGKVQICLARVNSHIEIGIADTGIGIQPEFIDYVFERFAQGDDSTTRKYGGLGLGLSIVKHLVELHGGTVRAQSPGENKGATFSVHLPLTVVHESTAAGPRLHPESVELVPQFSMLDLTGIRILVVDDEPDARELVRRVLSDCRAVVTTASSADEALATLQRERVQVLVTDIGMPDVDGFELLRRVRALGATGGGNVPAIALTAFARSEDRTRALRAGFQVHVSKPVEPAELIATVASLVGRTEGFHT